MTGTNGRYLAERGYGQDLAVDARRASDRRGSRPDSAEPLNPDADPVSTGNLQVVFAGMEGQGVFMSPNQGQVWNLMTGTVGNPLIIDVDTGGQRESGDYPQSQWRLRDESSLPCLPRPAMPWKTPSTQVGCTLLSLRPTGGFDGLYHDQGLRSELGRGQHCHCASCGQPSTRLYRPMTSTDPNYAITLLSQGNLYLTLSTDPTNPNIVYLGSFGNTANDVAGSL